MKREVKSIHNTTRKGVCLLSTPVSVTFFFIFFYLNSSFFCLNNVTLQFLGIAKVFVLWYKKDVFRQLLNELAGIWPMPPLEEEAQIIKNKSLAALRITHRCKCVYIKT